jgi:anti-anti-sigma factor
MPIKCEEYSQVCVITLDADFVGDQIAQTRSSIDELIDKRQIVDFVFDFEKAGFVDSEGLETLLLVKRRCEELFGQVKLVNLDENCRKILEVTRLEHRFECHNELAAALKTMR